MRPTYTEELDFNLESPEFAPDMHARTITELFDIMSEQNSLFSFLKYCNFDICKDTDLEEVNEGIGRLLGRHRLERRILHRDAFGNDIDISSTDDKQIRKNIEELYNRLFINGCEECGRQKNERMIYVDYFIINKRVHPELLEQYPTLTEDEIHNIFMKHLWTFVDFNRKDTSISGKLINTYVVDDLIEEPHKLEQETLKYMEFSTGLLENVDFSNYQLVLVEYPYDIFNMRDVNNRFQKRIEYHCVYFYKSDTACCVYILPEDEDIINFLQVFQKSQFKQPERYGYTVVSRDLFDRIRVGIYNGYMAFIGSYEVGVVVTCAQRAIPYPYAKRPAATRIENSGFNTIDKTKEILIPVDGIDEGKEYWKPCCEPIVIERTFKVRQHRPVEMLNMREVQVVAKYVSSMSDLFNISKMTKEYRGLIESFHYNPVPLRTGKEYQVFNDVHPKKDWRYHHYDDINLTHTPVEMARYYVALDEIWNDLGHAVEYKRIQVRLIILHAAEENSE